MRRCCGVGQRVRIDIGPEVVVAFVGGVDADQTLGRDLVVLGCLGC